MRSLIRASIAHILDNSLYLTLIFLYFSGDAGLPGPNNPCSQSSDDPSMEPPCNSDGEKYVGVFMLAQILHGVGFTPMFTLGTVYIDDNCNPSTAALYVG